MSCSWRNITIGLNIITEQPKFIYSPIGKAFEKQIRTIEEQGKNQVKALEVLKRNTQKLTIKAAIPETMTWFPKFQILVFHD